MAPTPHGAKCKIASGEMGTGPFTDLPLTQAFLEASTQILGTSDKKAMPKEDLENGPVPVCPVCPPAACCTVLVRMLSSFFAIKLDKIPLDMA